MGRLGPTELILLLSIPIAIFLIGFFVGKSRGYAKGLKEGLEYKSKN